MLAEDIVRHKQRLGGTFAIAMAVPTREMRDNMKEVFGPQGIFVCLRLSKETNFKRVEARHSGGDAESNKKFVGLLTGIYDFYKCHHGRPSYKHRYSNESVFLYWCDSRDRWQVNEISLNT